MQILKDGSWNERLDLNETMYLEKVNALILCNHYRHQVDKNTILPDQWAISKLTWLNSLMQ
jgi:hypothetical protein